MATRTAPIQSSHRAALVLLSIVCFIKIVLLKTFRYSWPDRGLVGEVLLWPWIVALSAGIWAWVIWLAQQKMPSEMAVVLRVLVAVDILLLGALAVVVKGLVG